MASEIDDSLQSICVRLDRKIYPYWSYVMKSFLKDKKMWGYIIDTLHKLMNENDEKYAKLLDGWEVRNSKIIT